jgi:hypothetical protein
MLLYGIKALFLGLSVLLCNLSYPLIPKLYNLFMDLSNFRILKEDFIFSIWNNLYVLVGVVVLFAIAIKLISAMVNPDTLGDNKKGAKGAYFRAVFAVILIFLAPIAFRTLFNIQDKLLSDNFLTSRIFGYSIDSDSAGQVLAWETFSAFCAPVDEDNNVRTWDDLTEDEKKKEKYVYYFAGYGDINYTQYALLDIYKEDMLKSGAATAGGIILGWPEAGSAITMGSGASIEFTDFQYHSILCPLAGLLVVYELVLLCMDTLFRAVKLAVLQLMLPIVLGAYVFNGEILKKWAKEFFSTYVIIFLKVLAIGFMIIIINVLKGVLL